MLGMLQKVYLEGVSKGQVVQYLAVEFMINEVNVQKTKVVKPTSTFVPNYD
jgi:hypothetical protein